MKMKEIYINIHTLIYKYLYKHTCTHTYIYLQKTNKITKTEQTRFQSDLKACENRKVLKFDLKISKEKEDFIKDSEKWQRKYPCIL